MHSSKNNSVSGTYSRPFGTASIQAMNMCYVWKMLHCNWLSFSQYFPCFTVGITHYQINISQTGYCVALLWIWRHSTAGTRPMRDHRRFLIQNTIKPSSQLHTAAFAIILTTRMPQVQQVVILKTSESWSWLRIQRSLRHWLSTLADVKASAQESTQLLHSMWDSKIYGEMFPGNSQAARQARIQACIRLQCWSLYGWADLHFCVILRPFSYLHQQIPAGHQGSHLYSLSSLDATWAFVSKVLGTLNGCKKTLCLGHIRRCFAHLQTAQLTRNRFQYKTLEYARAIQRTFLRGQRFFQMIGLQIRRRWAPMLRLWNWSRLGLNWLCPAPVLFSGLSDRLGDTRKSARVWSHGYNDFFRHRSSSRFSLQTQRQSRILCDQVEKSDMQTLLSLLRCHVRQWIARRRVGLSVGPQLT